MTMAAGKAEIRQYPSRKDAAQAGAASIRQQAADAIAARGIFTLVIPGGRSPLPLFKELARGNFPWDYSHIFWGDERCLPQDHPESNFRLAREHLIAPAGISGDHVHPIPVDILPEEAAAAYQREIEQFFSAAAIPCRFDCVVLGMGADGHVASILVEETDTAGDKAVFATQGRSGSPPVARISLGYSLLLGAGKIILIVNGEKKEKTLCLAASPSGKNLPVARIISHPETVVLLTQ